jgi:hypothetical protein
MATKQYDVSLSDDEFARVEKIMTVKFPSFKRSQVMRALLFKGLCFFEKQKGV